MINTDKKICVMGLGYIGLPTSALLANRGFNVHGVDINQNVIDTINNGDIHIVEPGLDTFVRAAVESGKLKAFLEPDKADVYIIAVPTPFKANFEPDISYVIEAVKAILPYLKNGNIVLLESTSPVGTTDKIWRLIQEAGFEKDSIYVAHCPERVLPGFIMKELIENDRIVGGVNSISTTEAAKFYKNFVHGQILTTDAKTAEMAKLTENSFRDVNIAFANELSLICDRLSINVHELIKLANHHPRVNILKPGVGVGGHCIAVDPWFIIHSAKDESKLIKNAREVNLNKTKWVLNKINESVKIFEKENNRLPKLSFMGLAFKPDIDDLRESPALMIVKDIIKNYTNSIVVEPNCESVDGIKLTDVSTGLEEADIIIYLVAHKEFKTSRPKADKIIFDFCGVFAE